MQLNINFSANEKSVHELYCVMLRQKAVWYDMSVITTHALTGSDKKIWGPVQSKRGGCSPTYLQQMNIQRVICNVCLVLGLICFTSFFLYIISNLLGLVIIQSSVKVYVILCDLTILE
jgi:hypothetical protein